MFWTWFFAILSFVLALYTRKKYESIVAAAFMRGDDIEQLPRGKSKIYEFMRPLMPGGASLEWISEKIVQAKLKNTPEQVWAVSYVMFALFAAMALYLGLNLFKDRSVAIIFSVFGGIAGASLPLLYVYLEAQKADRARVREMLPLIQQLKVLAKSGLGTTFGALASIAVEDSQGVLAEDLREVLNEVSLGRSRREAILSMVDRSRSKLLREVMELILDAEDKELPLYGVLEGVESRLLNDIEVKADEATAKAEDKMAIPLAAMLLPANMLIMIAPGVISAKSLLNF
ncbi:MAG: type II secretion system F family protein [Pelotomaculum sp.]|nr:type II secretion system F family protein [Pelotomaculum sp.]